MAEPLPVEALRCGRDTEDLGLGVVRENLAPGRFARGVMPLVHNNEVRRPAPSVHAPHQSLHAGDLNMRLRSVVDRHAGLHEAVADTEAVEGAARLPREFPAVHDDQDVLALRAGLVGDGGEQSPFSATGGRDQTRRPIPIPVRLADAPLHVVLVVAQDDGHRGVSSSAS